MLNTFSALIRKHHQLFKFIIAGGTAFAVNIMALYSLTDLVHVYYLVSTVLAFMIAFCVSFILQKFWTFRDHSRDRMHIQLSLYLGMQGINLCLNAALMYVFVEYLHVWYILSQAIIAIGLAVMSFFINRRFIFKPQIALP
mgnify:CR=1 FL=1